MLSVYSGKISHPVGRVLRHLDDKDPCSYLEICQRTVISPALPPLNAFLKNH
jgi:hypothetical protein